jgi:hypothetical protein
MSVDTITSGLQQKYGSAPDITVIPEAKGALIKLNISTNAIGAEQEGDLQRICVASGIELVI